jgi:hypothetical protein
VDIETEAVCVSERVRERVSDNDAESVNVSVFEVDRDSVDVSEVVWLAVHVAVIDKEAVCVREFDNERLSDSDAECVTVLVPETVCDMVQETDPV